MVDVALIEETIDGVESSSPEPRILRATIDKTGGFTLSGLKGVTYRVEAHYLPAVGADESNEPIRVTPKRINADKNIGEIKLILSRN